MQEVHPEPPAKEAEQLQPPVTPEEEQPGLLEKALKYLEAWLTDDGFTGHGIPRLFEGPMVARMIWFVLTCTALVFICHGTASAIDDYAGRPFVTSISLNVTDEIEFPAVTVCPSHQFRPGYDPAQDLKSGAFREKACNASQYILDFGFGDPITSNLRNEVGREANSWSTDNARKIEKHWQTHLIDSGVGFGGACATFNGDGTFVAKHVSDMLDVSLSVMTPCSKTLSGEIPTNQGFVIILHDPSESGTEAVIRSSGIVLQPGTRTVVRFLTQTRTQTSNPIGPERLSCQGGSYRRGACFGDKLAKVQQELCGCSNPAPFDQPHVSCHAVTDRDTASRCLRNHKAEIQKRSSEDCPDECSRMDYRCMESSCMHPSQAFVDTLWQYMITSPLGQEANMSKDMPSGPESEMFKMHQLRQSVLMLSIGPSDIAKEQISIDLKYPDAFALISSIGGTWSFWLGFSIVTFAELFLTPLVVTIRLIRGKKEDA